MTSYAAGRRYLEPHPPVFSLSNLAQAAVFVLVIAFLAATFMAVDVDLNKLIVGLPKVAGWFGQMFPPDLSDIKRILRDAFQTLAMATVGTIFALLAACVLAPLAATNTTP